MKKLLAILGLTLMASTVSAHHIVFGGNPDLYASPLLEHGTGESIHAIQRGVGDEYASQLVTQPSDHSDKARGFLFSDKYDPDGNRDFYAY